MCSLRICHMRNEQKNPEICTCRLAHQIYLGICNEPKNLRIWDLRKKRFSCPPLLLPAMILRRPCYPKPGFSSLIYYFMIIVFNATVLTFLKGRHLGILIKRFGALSPYEYTLVACFFGFSLSLLPPPRNGVGGRGRGNNWGGAVGNYQKTEPGNQWKTTTIDGVARNIARLLFATPPVALQTRRLLRVMN
jgi:hypothetical protein